MILFKPRLDVSFEKIVPDKHGRCLVAEVTVDGKKIVYMNIYAPNEPKHRAQFFREISNSYLKMYANENIVLAGDTNCAINSMDKRGGRPVDETQEAFVEFQSFWKHTALLMHGVLRIHNLMALHGVTHQWKYSVD